MWAGIAGTLNSATREPSVMGNWPGNYSHAEFAIAGDRLID